MIYNLLSREISAVSGGIDMRFTCYLKNGKFIEHFIESEKVFAACKYVCCKIMEGESWELVKVLSDKKTSGICPELSGPERDAILQNIWKMAGNVPMLQSF